MIVTLANSKNAPGVFLTINTRCHSYNSAVTNKEIGLSEGKPISGIKTIPSMLMQIIRVTKTNIV